MKIEQIKLTDHIVEMWELFSLHRDELATKPEIMILNPDWDRYRNLEEADVLITLALYDDRNLIIGYSITLIYPNMHYKDLIDAFNDVVYIHSNYRKSSWGLKLIRQTEEEARKKGAHRILFHGKENTKFSSLMPKLGYYVQDVVFGREL